MSTPPGGHSRAARVIQFVYTGLALLLSQLPPLFPPTIPEARVATWYLTAALTAVVAVLVTWRPGTPRAVILTLAWGQALATMANAFVFGDILAMFSTWVSIPALALLAGQIGPRARKALLATHVITSAIWLGVGVTFVLVSVIAMNATDIETAKVSYELLVVFDMTLLPNANFAASLAGIALGLTTAWGLMRYWWVAIKFFIPLVILFGAFGYMHPMLESAAAQATRLAETGGSVSQIDGAAEAVFWSFGVSTLSLAAAMLLSLYKPGGRTRRGRRQLEQSRQRRMAERTAAPGPVATPSRPSAAALPSAASNPATLAVAQPATQLPADSTPPAAEIAVTVADTRLIADDTAALTLRAADGSPLPRWAPGAHIDLVLPSGRVRQYSLYGDPSQQDTYHVAVLREPDGRGGSTEIHDLRGGSALRVRGPRNNFPLTDAGSYLFIAGGIGIVPFLPMMERLDAARADWQLVYRGASLSRMAFATSLADRFGSRVSLLPSDTHARPDLTALLRGTPESVAVYACGPESLLNAVELAVAAHRPHGSLHLERFAASQRETAPNAAFTAELADSDATVEVAEHETLLAAIQRVNPAIDLSCEDGVCGSCRTRVLDGVPEHRDDVLQPHERDRVDVIYPCVSRARGARIVLDV